MRYRSGGKVGGDKEKKALAGGKEVYLHALGHRPLRLVEGAADQVQKLLIG